MQLILSDTETTELRRALDLHLQRLEEEIARTEDREFKEDLLSTFHVLDGVRSAMKAEHDRVAAYSAEEWTVTH